LIEREKAHIVADPFDVVIKDLGYEGLWVSHPCTPRGPRWQ
jgi:hypothetical protein